LNHGFIDHGTIHDLTPCRTVAAALRESVRLDSPLQYISNTDMKRKLVQAGSSLAVTLPVEVVKEFKLKKGGEVDVSIHPQTGAVTIRPGVRFFEGGKLTPRFEKLAEAIAERYAESFRDLAE